MSDDNDVIPDEREAVVQTARGLLGREFTGHGVTLLITEVEAYGGLTDPASHAYTQTPRSRIMFGEPWRLYVYRSYGIHWCVNIVTGPASIAGAVLLRAGCVIAGHDIAYSRRGNVSENQLARGPGNFSRCLGITDADLGTDVRQDGPAGLGQIPAVSPDLSHGSRVGISKAADVPWRFWITGAETVSAYRRNPHAQRE